MIDKSQWFIFCCPGPSPQDLSLAQLPAQLSQDVRNQADTFPVCPVPFIYRDWTGISRAVLCAKVCDYKCLTRFEMFYRIRQYSVQQTFLKKCTVLLGLPRSPFLPPSLFLIGSASGPRLRSSRPAGPTGPALTPPFIDTLGSHSSFCSIGLGPGSSSSATGREWGQPSEAGPGPRPAVPQPRLLTHTHLPVVLPVVISVSVVIVVPAIESVIVSSVSIVEVTVTLRKKERWKKGKEGPGASSTLARDS